MAPCSRSSAAMLASPPASGSTSTTRSRASPPVAIATLAFGQRRHHDSMVRGSRRGAVSANHRAAATSARARTDARADRGGHRRVPPGRVRRSCCISNSFVAMRCPARPRLAAEQLKLGSRAQRLDQLIEFVRLARVPSLGRGCVQHRRLVRERDCRPPADSQDAMLGLATEPVAAPEVRLNPGQDGALFKPPRVDDLIGCRENWALVVQSHRMASSAASSATGIAQISGTVIVG